MTAPWRPWQARILVWLPAVLLFMFSLAVYLWQSSGLAGRETGLRQSIAELETEVARLESIRQQAASERAQVVELDQQFSHLYQEVFGSLDDRLTQILRAVGGATREAGLLPGSFNYSAKENKKLQHVRFGIQFSVVAVSLKNRHLLAAVQASPQFLIVEHIGFAGEEGATIRDLHMSLKLATVFAEADRQLLQRLTGGIRQTGGPGSG
jgi:hypothetical protein